MEAETAPGEHWADSELTFAIVAHCKSNKLDAEARLTILPLITFAGSEWNAISRREVNGRFTLASDFVAPHRRGMQELPPTEHAGVRKLFTLRTSICPTLDEDEQTRRWTLIELAEDSSASTNRNAGDRKIEDWLQELGLATMAQNRCFQSIAHKQFRDATDANRACYQALVALRGNFRSRPKSSGFENNLKSRFISSTRCRSRRSSVWRAAAKRSSGTDVDASYFNQPGLFGCAVEMKQTLGTNLCWRAGTMDWQHDSGAK